LRRLVDQSLLYRAPADRYEIHELLRQYATEKLEVSGEAVAVHDAHTTHYTAVLQQWGTDLKESRQQEAVAEMDVEIENARAAWSWAVARGQVARLGRAIEGLCCFYAWRARYQEGKAACQIVTGQPVSAEEAAATTPAEMQRLVAKALAWQGYFCWILGRTELAWQLLRRGLALLERLELQGHDTRAERARALLLIGGTTVDSNRQEAKRLYEQSLALYRAVDDPWGIAEALAYLGRTERRLGFYGSETRRLLEESLALRRRLGDRRGMADTLHFLGDLAVYGGDMEESAQLCREAVAIFREIGDKGLAVGAQATHVAALLGLGEFNEARSRAEESLALCKELGFKRELALAFCVLSWVEVHCGAYEQARAHGEKGTVLAQEAGYQWGDGFSLFHLGCVALATEQYVKAHQLFQESIAVFRALKQWDEAAWVRPVQGILALRLDQPLLAEQYLRETLQTLVEVWGNFALMHVLPAIALFMADRGSRERAVELYAVASCLPYVAGSRWFEDVAGRRINAVATTLPPGVVAAAQERGRARDPGATAAQLLDELGT
jgi:tetratricopeptide (TPR) repeat protein